jgi:hypothetical protein
LERADGVHAAGADEGGFASRVQLSGVADGGDLGEEPFGVEFERSDADDHVGIRTRGPFKVLVSKVFSRTDTSGEVGC